MIKIEKRIETNGGSLLRISKFDQSQHNGELKMMKKIVLLENQADRMIDDLFNGFGDFFRFDRLLLPVESNQATTTSNRTVVKKVKQTDGSTNVIIEVPGYEKEQLSIKIANDTLQVSGKRDDGAKIWYTEFVGKDVIMTAKLKNGLLTINVKSREDKKEVEVKIE